ncbi:hypothetical protein AK812_SmicGene47314, partial [Symbiodinium microadriaticum]
MPAGSAEELQAKELLQSLEALQAAEMTTPPPRETEEEAQADDDGLGKEKATPEKRRLQAQETLVDNGEDAQPTFPSDELPTPFKSTQKDLSLATPKASSR